MNKNSNSIVFFNIASTIILQGIAFISGPIFSYVLGTNNYGIASVYLTWVKIASTVFSIQAAGTIAIARIKFPTEVQEKFQSSVLCLATISYLFFSIITFSITFILSSFHQFNYTMIALGLAHGWGMYIISAINTKFTYEFNAEKNFILSVLTSLFTVCLSLFLIFQFPSDENYWGRIIGQSFIYSCIGLFLLIYIIKRGKTIYNKEYWCFTLPIVIPTIFHLLSNIILDQSDRVMLQWMLDSSTAGIYSLACTFGSVLYTIFHALNNSWVPFYYEYTKQGKIKEMKQHAFNYIEIFTAISVVFILLSKDVFQIYANSKFWNGTDLIPFFSIGIYFVFLYSFPVNYEFYNKKTKIIALGTVCAAICNMLLNYLFIRLWGIFGALIATVIAHALQFMFHFLCARNIEPKEFPFKIQDFLPSILCVFFITMLYFLIKEHVFIRWSTGIIISLFILVRIIKRKQIF